MPANRPNPVRLDPSLRAKLAQWTNKTAQSFDRLQKTFDEHAHLYRVELDIYYFSAFIDYFAGDEKMMYFGSGKQARELAQRTWINVAGNALNEVDVTQVVDGKKTVLFTVPAFYNREMVQPVATEVGKASVYSAVVTANNIANHSADHGTEYLKKYLGERLDRMWHPEVMVKNAEAWNKIFAYFGRPPLVPTVAGGTPETKDNGDIRNDEVVGFDPL